MAVDQPWVETSQPRASSPTATRCGNCSASSSINSGSFDRGGTDNDAFDAGFEQRDRGVGVTHPTTALHVACDRGADVVDDRAVRRTTGSGRVEVDDVDPTRAGLREALRDRHGVIVIERFAFVVALLQLHDAAVAQVDRRIQIHI